MTDTAERKMRFLYALRTKGVTDARVLTAIEKGSPYGLAPVAALIANGGRAPA